MKITKDTQTVWKLESYGQAPYRHTIIGISYNKTYYVRTQYGIIEYTKAEMIGVYGLTEDQFYNIENSGI